MAPDRSKHACRIALACLVAALGGCSGLPERQSGPAECRAAFAASDARLREAGMIDAGARRIPGFPYLRVDRFLASYRDELDTPRAFRAWAGRLLALENEGRRVELGLLHDRPETGQRARRLADCGRRLLRADLADSRRRELLRARARVPDAYSGTARILGLYPLAVPFLKLGIAGHHGETRARFERADAGEEEGPPVHVYRPGGTSAPTRERIATWLSAAEAADPLGIPDLPEERMAAAARRYAPRWHVATAGRYDRPGAPLRAAGDPGVDPGQRRVYWRAGFARFDGAVLLQIAYTIWFGERPASGPLDPLAGALDGVVWRVTLDTDGAPLLYDSIHSCGCYHLFFPTDRLVHSGREGFWQERPVIADAAPATGPVAVHLESGTHYIRALSAAAGAAAGRAYALEPYTALRRRQPRLFDSQGLVPGTERLEQLFLWPAGVPSAGAMRQAGHHATAFVGKRHFDDPFLVERYFRRRH